MILITGGAGYIGSVLTRELLAAGAQVRVLDSQVFGNGLADVDDPRLDNRIGDIRDEEAVAEALAGVRTVIHLAAVANDPSFDLDPALGRSVNYESLEPLMHRAKEAGVRRFVYASSASVYGVSDSPRVDEDHPLVPITDYNRYKATGERILFPLTDASFETVAIRAATVCGPSPRQRLDLTVNLLTAQAVARHEITVFGGTQFRPNVHISDLVSVYTRLALAPSLGRLTGQALNVGNENLTVARIAEIVAEQVTSLTGEAVGMVTTESSDVRSYRLTSTRLAETLGFVPSRTVADAAREIATAILDGRLPDPVDDLQYYNVRWMAERGRAGV